MPRAAWRGELVDFPGDSLRVNERCRHFADGLLLVEDGRIAEAGPFLSLIHI